MIQDSHIVLLAVSVSLTDLVKSMSKLLQNSSLDVEISMVVLEESLMQKVMVHTASQVLVL